MKTNPLPLITTALTAMFVTQTMALEAPADDAPPPPAQVEKKAVLRFDSSEVEADCQDKVAFLGVATDKVPPLLGDHLDLNDGEGVFIRWLEPGSPGAQAGIAVNDVITKVSGQPVNSPKEFSTLISGQKPGDSIKIELIHKGKPTTLDIVLGTKRAKMANHQQPPQGNIVLDGFPEETADRIRDAIDGNLRGLNLDLDASQLPPQLDEAIQKLRLQVRGAAGQAHFALDDAKVESHTSATAKMVDDQGSVQVKSNGNSKEITVSDQNGNVTWSGPWDTDQDKAAAPAEVRKRVESLNLDTNFSGSGIRMNLRQVTPLENH